MFREIALASLSVFALGCAGNRPHHIQHNRAYALSDLSVEPRLINRGELQCELLSLAPLALRYAGAGGTAVLDLTINADGRVERVGLYRSSGTATVDNAALRIAPVMVFSPGRIGRVGVYTRFTLPLELEIQETPSSVPLSRSGPRSGCE